MAAREILFNSDARGQIAGKHIALANAVQVNLGPRGRNLFLDKAWGAPTGVEGTRGTTSRAGTRRGMGGSNR